MRCLDFTQLLSHQWKHPWNFTYRNLPRRRTFPTKKRPCNIGLSCKKIVSWNHHFGEGLLCYPKDHWALEWKGLNLYSRDTVLKMASFEGVRILRVVPLGNLICWSQVVGGVRCLLQWFLMRAFVACVFFFLVWASTIIYQKLIACLGAAPFCHVTVSKGNNDHQPTMKQHLSQNLETSKPYPSRNDKGNPRSKWSIDPRNL